MLSARGSFLNAFWVTDPFENVMKAMDPSQKNAHKHMHTKFCMQIMLLHWKLNIDFFFGMTILKAAGSKVKENINFLCLVYEPPNVHPRTS